VSTETNILIQRAAAELKTAGAREIYVFGSAAKGTGDAASDLDLAVSGLPVRFLSHGRADQRFDWPLG
jgi:predicted nucleotidyltransferase